MEELIKEMFEKAKTDKIALIKLKNMAVASQSFELASKLREIEKEFFPESDKVILSKKTAKELSTLFRMVELNVADDICWLVYETIKEYNKSKDLFDLKTAASILARKHELFYK